MNKIVAIVPMRHDSQRIQGKNYRQFDGKPLFQYIIQSLLSCPEIEEVVVDTDSQPIMDGLKQNFPQVRVLTRPEWLRDGEIPMNEVLLHTTENLDGDFYLQTHSTNPLLKSETLSKSIQVFLENYPAFDSLFSVTRLQSRLWDALGQPINHDPSILLRTQDLQPVYEENSCIYIFTRKILVKRRNRLGERPYMFEISPIEAFDIDEEGDFILAELIQKGFSHRNGE